MQYKKLRKLATVGISSLLIGSQVLSVSADTADDIAYLEQQQAQTNAELSYVQGAINDLQAQKEHGTEKRIVPIALKDRGVIRAGMSIYCGGRHVGWVTSGTMVPYCVFDGEAPTDQTAKRSIGFAYLCSDVAEDAVLEIDVRGKRLKAARVARHARQDQPPYLRPIL